MVSVDWGTKVINVPQSDMVFVSGTLYSLDTDTLRLALRSLEASEGGMPFLTTHQHNTEVTIAGTTYARTIEIINGYTVTFEDGQYAVRLDGSNNNLFDEGVVNRNQVSIIPTNSAGLISIDPQSLIPDEAFLSVAYDSAGPTIKMGVWLERAGSVVTSPTSTTIYWYEPDGTLLFTASDSSPDVRGHFEIDQSQALADDTGYYAVVSVTDSSGTITTRRGVPTAT
jgi:hypothetical protein